MQAAQAHPHPTTTSSAVAWRLLISLVIGAVFGFYAGLLLISKQGALIGSFGLWPLILALISSDPRMYLRHPNWKLALPLLLAYLLMVASFIWYLPLALNVLGPFLAVFTVAAIAQRMKPPSGVGWLAMVSCGLTAGAGAALICWLMLGRGMDTLPITLAIVLSSGLAGPVGGALGKVSEAFRAHRNISRGRALDTPEQVCTPDTTRLSRRNVLLGLGGLAGLVATGAGFTWLTRSLLAHVVPLVTYKSFGQVKCLSWSPDGKRIVSASGAYSEMAIWMAIWDAASGLEIISYNKAMAKGYFAVQALAWSPDGTRIALGSDNDILDNPNLNAAIIDAATLRLIVSISAGNSDRRLRLGVKAVAWSPDSTRIATASNQVQVWDPATGKQLLNIDVIVSVVVWSPDGHSLVTDNGHDVQVWDAESGALLTTYHGHTDLILTVAWSPDSTKVVSGSLDGTVQVWDAESGRHLLTYRGNTYGVNAVAWSPDGRRIASAGIGDDVQVWDAMTGTLLFLYKGHTEEVNTLAWSPDGSRIASGSDDETVQVWQPA